MNEPGFESTATARLLVTSADLASALACDAQDAFPAVLATARMVALMEIASARILQPGLGAGELSVGVNLDVTHSAPTPLGATVTATSRLIGREGNCLCLRSARAMKAGKLAKQRINARSSMSNVYKTTRCGA
jgi:fluoroacetyl-CoA thioesterase